MAKGAPLPPRSHLALLRGINVGGRRSLPMARLKAMVGALGGRDVSTYIQSGNVLFNCQERDPSALAEELAVVVGEELDAEVPLTLLSRDELAAALAANPLRDFQDPRFLHLIFHSGPLTADQLVLVQRFQERVRTMGSRDLVQVVGRTAYLSTPDGFGDSELSKLLLGRGGLPGTARNWSTSSKLLALMAGTD